jgi:hypothetical protein
MKTLAAVLAAFLSLAAHAADPRDSGPLGIVITVHAAPVNRAALMKSIEETDAPQFQRWRDEGLFRGVRLLVNRHADSIGWDAMEILTFPDYAAVQRWNRIERATPAGLSQKTLALVGAIETAPGDFVREAGKRSANATWLVIPYELLVSVPEYLSYLDGYVVPQMDGWSEEGVLSHYGVFLPRYPAGRPWQSMLVLEYKDDAAFGARDVTTAKVRARLKDNPKWKAISDAKKNVRNEKAPVIADAILDR